MFHWCIRVINLRDLVASKDMCGIVGRNMQHMTTTARHQPEAYTTPIATAAEVLSMYATTVAVMAMNFIKDIGNKDVKRISMCILMPAFVEQVKTLDSTLEEAMTASFHTRTFFILV